MKKPPLIAHAGRMKTGWDFLIVVSILIVALVIPYRIGAGYIQFDVWYWLMTAIFGLDMLMRANTQVMEGLHLFDDRRSVVRRYLAGGFSLDLIAAFPLAAVAWSASSGTISGTLLFKVLLLLPLLKLFRVFDAFKGFRETVNISPALMRLVIFLFWFALLTHFITLGWLAIGAGERHRIFADQYLRALYWSITTITTIGYGDYGPDHDSNRQILYTMAVQLVGVGFFSYVIGNMATLIVNLDTARTEFRSKVEDMRNAMRIQRIPASLQERVNSYYHYLWETRKGLSNDQFMQDLPSTLRMDISLFLNRDILEKVSLFKDSNEVFARAVVGKLEPMVFLPGDWIIRQGEFGSCMYFVSRGDVEVFADGSLVAKLPEGSAFGETALLQGERRNASVQALGYCDVYSLSKDSFEQLRADFPDFDGKIRDLMNQRLKATCDAASGKQ